MESFTPASKPRSPAAAWPIQDDPVVEPPVVKQPKPRRRISAKTATVGIAGLVAAGAFAAWPHGPDYTRECVNRSTNVRVNDDDCENGHGGSGAYWFYGRGGSWVGVGQRVDTRNGSFTAPKSGSIARAGSSKAGSVSRGGFGHFGGHAGG